MYLCPFDNEGFCFVLFFGFGIVLTLDLDCLHMASGAKMKNKQCTYWTQNVSNIFVLSLHWSCGYRISYHLTETALLDFHCLKGIIHCKSWIWTAMLSRWANVFGAAVSMSSITSWNLNVAHRVSTPCRSRLWINDIRHSTCFIGILFFIFIFYFSLAFYYIVISLAKRKITSTCSVFWSRV